jgi:hypothetical protein
MTCLTQGSDILPIKVYTSDSVFRDAMCVLKAAIIHLHA